MNYINNTLSCLSLILLFFGNLVLAQELPQVTPTNPATASLGTYGDIPINTANGKMVFDIPIHSISVDGNLWPVSLGYSYGGLIAEGKPSLFGLGWGLNAYGAVRREIRGLPDGHENGYYGVNNIKSKIPNFSDGNWTKHLMDFEDFKKFRDGEYDSEVDKYSLTVGGISVSFKLRYDSVQQMVVPYFLHKNNYELDITMDPTVHHKVQSFLLTDDNGIKYLFSEQEVTFCEQGGTAPCVEDNVNGWLLKEVEYLNGEKIVFHYSQPQNYIDYNFAAAGAIWYWNIDEGPYAAGLFPVAEGYNHAIRATQVNRLLLEEIEFPEGNIEFLYSTIGNRTLYNQIKIKDFNNNLIDQYDLSHFGNRDLLEYVNKNNENFYEFDYYLTMTGNSIPGFYEAENNPPLAQDFWKFYNGANNTAAIDMGINGYNADKSPNFINTRLGALKTIKYPTGGTTSISYEQNQIKELYVPGTSGTEAPIFNNSVFVQLNPSENNSERHIVNTVTITEPVVAQMSHFIQGDLALGNYIRMSMTKIAESGATYNANDCFTSPPINSTWYPSVMRDARSKLKVPNAISEQCVYYPNPPITPNFFVEYGPDGCPYSNSNNQFGCQGQWEIDQSGSSEGIFVLLPGVYEIVITTNPHFDQPDDTGNILLFSQGSISSGFHLKWYQEPSDPNNENAPRYIDKSVGGIRVASITNTPLEGKNIIRNFSYTDDQGLSSGVLNHRPNESWTHNLSIIDPEQNPSAFEWSEEAFSLRAFSFLNESDGVPVYYQQVKVFDGNGGTISKYHTLLGNTTYQYPNLPKSFHKIKSIKKGEYIVAESTPVEIDSTNLITEISPVNGPTGYIYADSPVVVASKENLNYISGKNIVLHNLLSNYSGTYHSNAKIDENDEHPWSFKIARKLELSINFEYSSYPENPVLPNDIYAHLEMFDFWPYREIEYDSYLKRTTELLQGVETKKVFSYNDKYMLVESLTYSSEGDTLTTEYIYPYDDLINGESQFQDMQSINQIGNPVMTISNKNTHTLQVKKTNYSQIQNGYKQSSIQIAKGENSVEERLVFDSYNNRGKVTQLRKSNGTVISVLYGYGHRYPVAKIENATFSEALNAIDPQYNYSTNFQNLSELDLQVAIQSIRDNLPQVIITSYTYRPLIGVSTVTDQNGNTLEYKYDSLNRLEYVVDQNGKVLSHNEYNYKQ